MKRLCILSPDLLHAHQLIHDLKSNGVAEKHIYVVARYGTELENMPDAGPVADDFLPAYKRGLELGGTAGLLAGLLALAFPPAGIVVGGGLVLLVGLWGSGLGGLLASIAGGAFPDSRLKAFETAIEAGQILVMADVPAYEVSKFETLIRQFDPEVEISGIEPPARLIP